jgi:hypothetical protein
MSAYLKKVTTKYHEKYGTCNIGGEFCEFIKELIKHLNDSIIVEADPENIRPDTLVKWYANLQIPDDDLDFYFENTLSNYYVSAGEEPLGPRHPEVMIERALDRLDEHSWKSAKSFATFILQRFIEMDKEQREVYHEVSNIYEDCIYTDMHLRHDFAWFARRFDIFNPNPDNESFDQKEIDGSLLEELDDMYFDEPDIYP